ncbi:MAG TPA: DinB family protein [Candidatus Nitrosotalea sp.]|nr:DinB family protein [Candidatus Nitrosotalea sp.]
MDSVLKSLGATPTILAAVVKAGAPPRGQEWGGLEVASHLAIADRRYQARFVAALEGRDPGDLGGPGGVGVVGEGSLSDFEDTRARLIAFVRSLSPEQLETMVPHPRLGDRTLGEYVRHLVYHDADHLEQAARAATA